MKVSFSLFIAVSLLFWSCQNSQPPNTVFVHGKMSNVMRKGILKGSIAIDSLSQKGVYGLGPVAFLKGELLIQNGITYRSTISKDSILHTEVVQSEKAPFFVYAKTNKLHPFALKEEVKDLKTLEHFLDEKFRKMETPFLFTLEGEWKQVLIHSVNLPEGTKVQSPKDAHSGLIQYEYNSIKGTLIGFFSRKHQSVFTHHDTFLHCHFISDDKKVMGHLDSALFQFKDIQAKSSIVK